MTARVSAGVAPDLERAADAIAGRGGLLGRPLELSASTTSTNDDAKRAVKQGAPHGATFVAERQTAGRGRQGRAWFSPPGENLMLSVLLREQPVSSRAYQIPLVAGLAVRDVVARALPASDVKLKWPNDVVVGARKIAGVLVEAITAGKRIEAVVVGIGLNVHTRSFAGDLAKRATSIALEARATDPRPDRADLLADLLASLDRDLHVLAARGLGLLRARLDAADALRGLRVRAEAGDEGVACGFDDDGRLIVRRDDGAVTHWIAGEVHLATEANP